MHKSILMFSPPSQWITSVTSENILIHMIPRSGSLARRLLHSTSPKEPSAWETATCISNQQCKLIIPKIKFIIVSPKLSFFMSSNSPCFTRSNPFNWNTYIFVFPWLAWIPSARCRLIIPSAKSDLTHLWTCKTYCNSVTQASKTSDLCDVSKNASFEISLLQFHKWKRSLRGAVSRVSCSTWSSEMQSENIKIST